MANVTVLESVRFFGQDGLFDLHLQDGLIERIVPTITQSEGLLALPGFCESHAHLFGGGVTLAQLNLSQVHDADALRVALLRHAAATPDGEMVCAYAANYDLLGDKRPDRHALDAVLADRPLCITSTDFHCAWANTAALQAAGILQGADAGPGAEVVLAPDGLATGELREFAAMDLVRRLAPSGGREGLGLTGQEPQAITPAQRASDKAALLRAMQECLQHGITTVVNMDGNLYQAELLKELALDGLLPLNVSLPMTLVPGQSLARRAELLCAAAQAPVCRLSFGRVKMFMDGVFDTWTAFRTDDYPQKTGFRSAPLFDADEFAQICIEADTLGLQIAVHAVGDGAVRATLDGYAAARAKNGPRDARHRIEHIDMIHPDDLPRLAALGVVASMQPVHPPGLAGLPLEPTVSIMGPARWKDTFPWRTIKDQGVTLAFGTDWPVSPLSPLHALHCALSRQPWAEGQPDQRLALDEALAAYTHAGSYALFTEGLRGQLHVGMRADVVVLRGDVQGLAQRPDAVEIAGVYVDGERV
jgi:predicted amidohydrolase YtcJ